MYVFVDTNRSELKHGVTVELAAVVRSANARGCVEVPIIGLHKRVRCCTAVIAEVAVRRRKSTRRVDLERAAVAARPTRLRCLVEITVGS
jgi:predicted nucleotidyltransferase